jgi:translation initiation factor 4E
MTIFSRRQKQVTYTVNDEVQKLRLIPSELEFRYPWVYWFMHRQAGSKIQDYTNEIKKISILQNVNPILTKATDFWAVYSRLKRPGELHNISDYHFFKTGIRPIWEDNLTGGKWIVLQKA